MREYESNRSYRQEEDVIDLGVLFCDIWKGFKKFWWLFFILCSVFAAVSYGITVSQYHPMYQSKASFTVSTKTGYEESNTAYSFFYNTTTAEQMENLFPYILSSDVLMGMIKEDLGTDSVPGSINATAVENSNLFTMTVTSSDPAMAQRILNSAMEHFPEVSRYVIGETRLNIIQPATYPEEPYNRPDYREEIKKGILMGIGIGVVFLILYALTRKTIRKEEDLKEILNLSCIGMIPKVKFKEHGKSFNRSVDIYNDKVGRPFQEAVSRLAYKVERQMKEHSWNVLMVTSTVPGEGKSTVAWNLAMSLTENKKRVLLLDADMRNPSLEKMIGTKDRKAGLFELITGKAKVKEVIQKIQPGNVYFIGPGRKENSSVKALSSVQFAKFIEIQKKNWDYVIIDTPPCETMADAAAVAEQSDAIIYVILQDMAKQWQILDGIQSVGSSGTSIIGGVLNGIQSSVSGYGYQYYGYGKYGYGRYGYGHYGRYGYGRQDYGRYGHFNNEEMKDEK